MALGWPSVEAGLERISSRELSEWLAYDRLDPLAHQTRADWRAAQIAGLLAEINRDRKTRREPYTTADFMPDFGLRANSSDEDEGQTPEQMLVIVEVLNVAFGGRDLRT